MVHISLGGGEEDPVSVRVSGGGPAVKWLEIAGEHLVRTTTPGLGYPQTFAGGGLEDWAGPVSQESHCTRDTSAPACPRPAPTQLQSVIGFPISITSHKSAMLAWLVLVLGLWRAAVVEMWKYKIPPFKVWLGGGEEDPRL